MNVLNLLIFYQILLTLITHLTMPCVHIWIMIKSHWRHTHEHKRLKYYEPNGLTEAILRNSMPRPVFTNILTRLVGEGFPTRLVVEGFPTKLVGTAYNRESCVLGAMSRLSLLHKLCSPSIPSQTVAKTSKKRGYCVPILFFSQEMIRWRAQNCSCQFISELSMKPIYTHYNYIYV